MTTTMTEDHVGTDVVNAQGEKIGIVSKVSHGTAYVDVDPGITGEIKAKLGWEDDTEEVYPLQDAAIETVTDDQIRLRSNL